MVRAEASLIGHLRRLLVVGVLLLGHADCAQAADERADRPREETSAPPSRGERRPLWEAGAGIAAAYLPDYRGADEARAYLLPFPYFVYRGEILRADREGLRAKFFGTERVELDVSLGATVPVRSQKNRARAGMPNLGATVEIGPVLEVHLRRAAEHGYALDLRLPVRRAFTIEDGGMRDIGTLFFPHLNVDRKIDVAGSGWNLGTLAGAYFGDRRYHDFFYGVAPAFATAERPAYAARAGFAGWQAIVAMSTTYGKTWVGAFLKADSVRGAVFDDSPLVRRRFNLSAGIGVSYVFATSSHMVEWPR
jgi:outer membrane scaffolding protein for murein synthesis (MipA/OmpV family)